MDSGLRAIEHEPCECGQSWYVHYFHGMKVYCDPPGHGKKRRKPEWPAHTIAEMRLAAGMSLSQAQAHMATQSRINLRRREAADVDSA